MAYRRKPGVSSRASPTLEDFRYAAAELPSLAARCDSSFAPAYGESAIASSAHPDSNRERSSPTPRDSTAYEYTSMKNLNESKYGFWVVLARKAKAILEDDDTTKRFENHGRHQPQAVDTSTGSQEGLTIVENKTADIIHETRKLHIRRKGSCRNAQNQAAEKSAQHVFPQIQTDYETQLKASRDVANAIATKAKLLLQELKTVKADMAFTKERCGQLEEENKMLREGHEKGSSPEDDDLIRLQLETLLAEKARLAHENSIHSQENRFLREIVEYHPLTMQDVVYADEGIEEVKEVYSIQIPPVSPASAVSKAPTSFSPTTPAPNDAPRSTPAIIVPEACPIIPGPPTHFPQAVPPKTNGFPIIL